MKNQTRVAQSQFNGITFEQSNFEGQDLKNVIFNCCTFRGLTNFANANLEGAIFQNVVSTGGGYEESGISFLNADLKKAKLYKNQTEKLLEALGIFLFD